jgi:hypothetical protein
MLADSNFLHQLEENAFSPDGNPMCVYGDPAYPHRVHLQALFRNGDITERMKEFKTNERSESFCRVVVWRCDKHISFYGF